MGADIHVVLEKKFGDKWIGLKEVSSGIRWESRDGEWKQEFVWCRATSRNYKLFGMLAGVRREGPDPKGMPEDASELARALFPVDDSDYHSHSHCSLREYLECLAACEDKPAEVFLKEDSPQVKHPYSFYFGMWAPDEDEEYRVVFCFDN